MSWLNVHLWGPMWPNIFAPSAFSLAAVGLAHVRTRRQAARHHDERMKQAAEHHEDLKQHITASTGGGM